jgi:hypothetical protein
MPAASRILNGLKSHVNYRGMFFPPSGGLISVKAPRREGHSGFRGRNRAMIVSDKKKSVCGSKDVSEVLFSLLHVEQEHDRE